MLPKYHIVIGLITTIFIYLLFNLTILQATIILLSSILIDIDHYFIYVIKKKDLSIKKATYYFYKRRKNWLKLSINEQKKYKRFIYIFHGIEFWIILYFISLLLPQTIFILYGIAIHITLDFIDFQYFKQPFYAKFSQLYVYKTNKKKTQLLL